VSPAPASVRLDDILYGFGRPHENTPLVTAGRTLVVTPPTKSRRSHGLSQKGYLSQDAGLETDDGTIVQARRGWRKGNTELEDQPLPRWENEENNKSNIMTPVARNVDSDGIYDFALSTATLVYFGSTMSLFPVVTGHPTPGDGRFKPRGRAAEASDLL
ncbi:hypothetical protein NP493_928g01063, partial [Ridgeia piscesae]